MKGSQNITPPPSSAPGNVQAPATRALWIACIVFAGGFFVFIGGFVVFTTHISRLSTPAYIQNADAIIVLTGGERRLEAAFDLLRAGKGRRLLISGVHPDTRIIDLQRVIGSDESLFACCVDIDRKALDTIGNAAESAKWINIHMWDSVIVVTNNYHMPRSLLELNRIIAGTTLLPYPVVNTPLDGGKWLMNSSALRVLLTEYTKYIAALIRGFIA